MSLRGRYVIDRIKRAVSSHLKMPVPPYGEPLFWENVYQKMENATPINPDTQLPEFDDTFEWGDIKLSDVLEYQYRQVTIDTTPSGDEYASSSRLVEDGGTIDTTFAQTIGVEPMSQLYYNNNNNTLVENDEDAKDADNGNKKEPIVMLGCGNSRMGEDLAEHGWRGPIIQVDIAAKALEMIARRSTAINSTTTAERLQFLQEDATHLSSLRNDTIAATIDKGLLDALFCADEYDQMADIVKTVLRVLRPGGTFCVFSFSRPEFILPRLLPLHNTTTFGRHPTWKGLEMQQLDRFMIYRLQKGNKKRASNNIQEPNKRKSKSKKQ